jgi:hypothetical protein
MQRRHRNLKPLIPLLALLAAALPQASLGCALVVGTGGQLGPNMAGTEMSTEGIGGITGTLTITSVLTASTITVEAPTYSAPVTGTAEVSYAGISGLTGVSQPYTSQRTSFQVPGLIGTAVVLVRNRIRSDAGLATGDYQTVTVVTCS